MANGISLRFRLAELERSRFTLAGLRVAQVCAVDFTVKNFLLPLIRFLESQGCETTAVCSEGAWTAGLRADGVRIETLDIRRNYNLPAHTRSMRALTKLFRGERFDVVHTHTPIAALIGRIAAARAGVPIRIYTAHGFYFHERMKPWTRRAHIELEKLGAKYGHYIFTQSEEDRQTAVRVGIETEHKIRTIGNGVDLRRFSSEAVAEDEKARLREEFGLRSDHRVVVVIGRLVAEKGYRELFEAAFRLRSEFPKLRLLVIGQALESDRGGGWQAFEDQISQLGETVVFADMRKDVPGVLSLAEVYTLPSYREGMPRSIIEAMGMSLPVVATNIRGCREEVVDGGTGFLVPVQDSGSLADRIGQLLRKPELARAMGARGRERALELFDENLVLERQWEVYKELIASKGLQT